MKATKLGYFIFLLLAGIFVFIIAHSILVSNQVDVTAKDGQADLTRISMGDNMAVISDTWMSYPDELYGPKDFTGGNTKAPVTFNRGSDSLKYHYGTHRMILKTKDYDQLAFYFKSLDYSTKVFINGEEMDEIGKVGKTAGTSEAKTRECIYVFTPENETTELILQYSNFVHKDGGNPPTIYTSIPNNIFRLSSSLVFSNVIFVGCLLTAFLYYIFMFFIHDRRRLFLYFGLCCFLFALRYLPIDLIFPDISWNISIRVEYFGVYAASMLLGIFVQCLFPTILSVHFKRFVFVIYTIYLLMVMFAPTTFFTGLVLYVQIISFAIILYVCIKLIKPASSSFNCALGLFAMAAILLAMLNDSLGLNNLPNLGRNDFMSIGVYIFVLSYMIILQLQASENEKMLHAITQDNISLEKLNRMKTEFVSNVSHELKTPLTVMSNKAQLTLRQIEMGDIDSRSISANLGKIVSETENLSLMIEEILEKTKDEENSVRTVMEEVDVNLVIKDILDDASALMGTNGNKIASVLSEDLPLIKGDPVKIKQAIVNLLSNADKNTKRGKITLTTRAEHGDNDKVIISVKDTGTGIDEKHLPNIFDRYYMVDGNSTKGTGLGLYITKSIVEDHDGIIQIESEKGIGTEFRIVLPVREHLDM